MPPKKRPSSGTPQTPSVNDVCGNIDRPSELISRGLELYPDDFMALQRIEKSFIAKVVLEEGLKIAVPDFIAGDVAKYSLEQLTKGLKAALTKFKMYTLLPGDFSTDAVVESLGKAAVVTAKSMQEPDPTHVARSAAKKSGVAGARRHS